MRHFCFDLPWQGQSPLLAAIKREVEARLPCLRRTQTQFCWAFGRKIKMNQNILTLEDVGRSNRKICYQALEDKLLARVLHLLHPILLLYMFAVYQTCLVSLFIPTSEFSCGFGIWAVVLEWLYIWFLQSAVESEVVPTVLFELMFCP